VLAPSDMRIAGQGSFLSGRLDDAGWGPGWSNPQIPQGIMAIRVAYIQGGRVRRLWQCSVFGDQIVDAHSFMPAVWG
jgi:hypothetical protein